MCVYCYYYVGQMAMLRSVWIYIEATVRWYIPVELASGRIRTERSLNVLPVDNKWKDDDARSRIRIRISRPSSYQFFFLFLSVSNTLEPYRQTRRILDSYVDIRQQKLNKKIVTEYRLYVILLIFLCLNQ